MSHQPRSRNYVFTLFDWTQLVFDYEHMSYLVYQIEKAPETGRLHAQGYVELHNAKTFSALQKVIGKAHLESRKGTAKQAREYCMKEESRVEGPWEFGEISQQGKRNDIEKVVALVKEGATLEKISQEAPNEALKFSRGIVFLRQNLDVPQPRQKPKIWYIWGDSGVGKSKWTRENFPDAYIANDCQNAWFDGYDRHKTVVFDEFDGNFPRLTMLRLLDYGAIRLPIKGGYVTIHADQFVFTSNKSPEEIYHGHPAWLRRISEFGVFVSEEGGVVLPPRLL